MEAIESTIKTWILQGGCDLMTDHFLEEQTFSDDRAQACKTFEKRLHRLRRTRRTTSRSAT